jgi:hypothetical protein
MIAMPIPAMPTGRSLSWKRKADAMATNSGLVLTNTTELMTDVESSELVQNPK